eukprot:1196161-Pleurochrysis_carterae.AAC.1
MGAGRGRVGGKKTQSSAFVRRKALLAFASIKRTHDRHEDHCADLKEEREKRTVRLEGGLLPRLGSCMHDHRT